MLSSDFKCSFCNKASSSHTSIQRHLRVVHGKDGLDSDTSSLRTGDVDAPREAINLPKLDISRRKGDFVGDWGSCDVCLKQSTRRWFYKNSTRGEVTVCVECRERFTKRNSKKKVDILDSHARLPGSYGAARR